MSEAGEQQEPASELVSAPLPAPRTQLRARQSVRRVQEAPPLAPTFETSAPPADVEPSPPAASPSGPARDLSPLAAARTWSDSSGSWTLPSTRTSEEPSEQREELRLSQLIPGLTRGLHDRTAPRHAAQDLNALVAKPWDLILQPLKRARYVYRGTGFDAIIRSDGSVAYRKNTGLQIMPSQTNNVDGPNGPASALLPPAQTWGFGFRDAYSGKLMGYDPHASERRRFLEQTRPLRELLHERAVRDALVRADAHLDRELALIRAKLNTDDVARPHASLFALWDECLEDEIGEGARRRIERFIRECCAAGTPVAFSEAEVAAFNRTRSSKRLFSPYAALPDAGS